MGTFHSTGEECTHRLLSVMAEARHSKAAAEVLGLSGADIGIHRHRAADSFSAVAAAADLCNCPLAGRRCTTETAPPAGVAVGGRDSRRVRLRSGHQLDV